MANLRRSITPKQSLTPLVVPQRGARLRWPIIAGVVLAGLLGLAWLDGGEEPLRPIAQVIELPDQRQ